MVRGFDGDQAVTLGPGASCSAMRPAEVMWSTPTGGWCAVTHKVCSRCKISKPITAFRNGGRKGRPRNPCSSCAVEINGEHRKALRRSGREGWCKVAFASLRIRARASGIPFDLTYEDLLAAFPENMKCPALGVPFVLEGRSRWNPSVDRLCPRRGYVAGNVAVISKTANLIKQDAGATDIQRVADWLREREQLLTHRCDS